MPVRIPEGFGADLSGTIYFIPDTPILDLCGRFKTVFAAQLY